MAAAWGTFALFTILVAYGQAVTGTGPVLWRTVLLGPLLYGPIGTLLTPVVFVLAARFDLTAGRAH